MAYRTVDPNLIRSLRSRALISPRAARSGGYEGIAGQGERSASDAGWPSEAAAARGRFTRGDELRAMKSEFGSPYQDLAAAHDADQDTEDRTNRYQSRPYGYGTTSDNPRRLRRDESDRRNHGGVPFDHNNSSQFQSGGRVSKGGSAGREQGQDAQHIDGNRNSRQYPKEAKLRDGEHWLANYASSPQGVRGGVQGSSGNGDPNDWYSAGNGRRWG